MRSHRNIALYPLILAIVALALIWFVGHGQAGQTSAEAQQLMAADTIDLRGLEDLEGQPQPPPEQPNTITHYTRLLATMAYKIYNNYMEPIDAEDLAKQAINGMLENLDPFSVVMERKSYDQLMESTHGKYEGLGMQIAKRGDYITIISPMEGTPAYNMGLMAGDKVISIDGHDTKDMNVEDASNLMRGKAGTKVKLTIQRTGLDDPLDYELERAVIELKSVNYAGVVEGDIGYVRLSKFSETATDELRSSIDSLMKSTELKGLILDLRSNGGGLLSQAIDVANLFLNQGDMVVFTKGHAQSSQREYYCQMQPLYKNKPLAILVDGGTASASEIVSGAIQDWDRGIVIGNTTFGKGLVQQVFPTPDPDIALKLTTAKYYIPSGRCIQRPDRAKKHPDFTEEGDVNLEMQDTAEAPDASEIFMTKGGRPVYGGGGVVPDIEIARELWKPIEINLERQNMFFDFAVSYTSKHPEVSRDFKVTDKVLEDFRQFCRDKSFDYKSNLQSKLEDFEDAVKAQGQESSFNEPIDALSRAVEKEKEKDFDKSKDWIAKSIKREIIRKLYGEKGVYEELVLKNDVYVQKALEVLRETNVYSKLLAPQPKSKS